MKEMKDANAVHSFYASDFDKVNLSPVYLVKTNNSNTKLDIDIRTNGKMRILVYQCEVVSQEGTHIHSFNNDANDATHAICEIYKKPVYQNAILWKQVYLTEDIHEDKLTFILKPDSKYIIETAHFGSTVSDNFLIGFNWKEETT